MQSLSFVGRGYNYQGGGLEAQITILLHEFAHTMDLIPRDKVGGDRSPENTEKILEHCRKAIEDAVKRLSEILRKPFQ